jgi:hypothetical protein
MKQRKSREKQGEREELAKLLVGLVEETGGVSRRSR